MDLFIGGARHHGTVTLTAEDVVVALDSGHKQILKNPFGNKPFPGLAAATIHSLAVPPASDHLLVTLTDGRVNQAWVLVPEERGFSIAMETMADWGVTAVHNLVKVSHRKNDDKGLYTVSELWYYSADTRRYERVPAVPDPVKGYTVEGVVMLPVDQRSASAWVLRKEGAGVTPAPAVYVTIDNRTVPLLNPEPGPRGPVAADAVTGVDARDLDGDGIREYLVEGVTGAHTRVLWVYHWDAPAGSFRFRAELTGDKGLIVAGAPGQAVVETDNRDYKSTDFNAVLTRRYTWVKDHFAETH